MVEWRFFAIIYLLVFLSSCCEPPFIDDISVCGDRVEDLGLPPSCINSWDKLVEQGKPFSASFHAYSIRQEDIVRFSLFDITNNHRIIEEVSGVLDDFGSRVTTTERCAYYLAHTFELPPSGSWPAVMLLEIRMATKDSTFELNLEVTPI